MPDPSSMYSIDAILLYPFCKYISKNFCKKYPSKCSNNNKLYIKF